VETLDVARVLALDHRPEEVAYHGLDDPGRAPRDALADAGDAVVRRDLDERRGEGVVRACAEMDRLLGLGRERPGIELDDLQACLPPQRATG